MYNKFKDADRGSLSPSTLSNYLHINTNMCSLVEFDPTSATNYWLARKERCPKSNHKVRQQEWFRGVFNEPNQDKNLQNPMSSSFKTKYKLKLINLVENANK